MRPLLTKERQALARTVKAISVRRIMLISLQRIPDGPVARVEPGSPALTSPRRRVPLQKGLVPVVAAADEQTPTPSSPLRLWLLRQPASFDLPRTKTLGACRKYMPCPRDVKPTSVEPVMAGFRPRAGEGPSPENAWKNRYGRERLLQREPRTGKAATSLRRGSLSIRCRPSRHSCRRV
jgi:hypothetical protein